MSMAVSGTSRRGFLKGLGLALGGAALVGADLLIKPKSAEAAGPGIPWSYMSQAQRDSWLLQIGRGDIGRQYTAPDANCKTWMRKVVYDASGYGGSTPFSIPSTLSNGYTWAYDPRAPRLIKGLRMATPGEIIQMKSLSGTPHTAIIGDVSSTTVHFVDCNWPDPNHPGPNWVQDHWLTWSTLENYIGIQYSIYQIQ